MSQKLPEHKKVVVNVDDDDDDDEHDAVDEMIKRTGCTEQHNAVSECIFDHKDWRKCQIEVKALKACMFEYNKQKAEEEKK